MRRTLRHARAVLLAMVAAGLLAGCASAAPDPINRGWDAPSPDAVHLT